MKFSQFDYVEAFRPCNWYYYYQYYLIFCKSLSLSVYAQDNQYYYNTNKDNSYLLNELEIIKKILETKVTNLATSLQIASSLS